MYWINKTLYNFIIDLVVFFSIVVWFVLALTIIIPFLWWYCGGGDYFYLGEFIEDMNDYKIRKKK